MSEISFTVTAMLAAAASKNLSVRFPADDELFLDLDSEEDFARFLDLFSILTCHMPDASYVESPSKSGLPKRHVVITMSDPISALERIAFQAALGSDRKHELLSLLALSTNPTPTCFFEKKETP